MNISKTGISLIMLLIVFFCPSKAEETEKGIKTYTVFKAGEGTDHYANGAVMTAFKEKLYCMWQSSPQDEDSDDTWVAYSWSTDGGQTWTQPKSLAVPSSEDYCTSGGWLVRGDTLTAFIGLWQKGLTPRGGRTYYMTSTDGQTWSRQQPVRMADGSNMNGILEQDPYTLPDGRIIGAAHFMPGLYVCPVYTDNPNGVSGWKKGSFESEDLGKQSRELEPSQYVRPDGSIVMLFRDQSSSFRKLASVSTDRGETWTKPTLTGHLDGRTKQCAGNLPDGTAFMVSCPSGSKDRWPLVLQLSKDGVTFDQSIELRSKAELTPRRYEGRYKTLGYSYPKATIWKDQLYISYSTNKEDIECTIVPLKNQVVWFDGKNPITYSVPKKVEPVVKVALDMWKSDMQQVTGMEPVSSARPKIKVIQGKGPADGFRIYIRGEQIVVEGNDGRGMAYGLLELSRMAGVSPWVWWGDVVPEKKERLVIDEDFKTEQHPSVAYRGIFLNDEDWSLRHWSYSTFERLREDRQGPGMPAPFGHIGPKTYKKIFQLLLRLRANAIWPGMHTGTTAFFKIPGAKAMADSCGIVIGTSHCEPLLRNNVDEWDVKERGAFNYRTNRETVQQYWIERLKEVKKSKDNMFTIGMRGIHDSSMEGYHTEQEKFDGLQQVINDQQKLLLKYIGDPSKQMQVFVPYKEVLQLYEKGLQIPDYVTLMWCDDNYGYMTRLSNAEEQMRKGGGGVYYHLSYWGRPHDYLWLTTTQPGLIYNEMRQAYDHNVRKLWIVNVHDPKVAGYDLELFLDMAWNIDCVSGESINNHYKTWLCREFGQKAGEQLFPVMHEFYRLCGMRRPEFMGWNQVEVDKKLYDRGLSQVRNSDWTEEQCDDFEARFMNLSRQVEEIGKVLRPELSDAYFAAVKYPVQAAAAHAVKMLEAERARRLANGSTRSDMFEHQEELKQAVGRSHAAYNRIHELTDYYNNKVAGGKWKNLMCDHPRDLPVFWAPLVPMANTGDVAFDKTREEGSLVATKEPSFTLTLSEGARTIQMLGHSMKAIAMEKDGVLTYRFDVEEEGDYLIRSALIPTQPNDDGDLRFSVSIDGQEPVVYSLKEPFRSERWKLNVLNGQAVRDTKARLSQGSHTMTIRALDDHIVVDQITIL